MTLKEQIMKLQTYKMHEGEDTVYVERDDVLKALEQQSSVIPQSLNPEADREESKAYCAECDHIEMCSWYPHDGCEWLKTDRYNAGYNAAKREIALSGEYERAYERGKADAHPDINDGKLHRSCTEVAQAQNNRKVSDKK